MQLPKKLQGTSFGRKSSLVVHDSRQPFEEGEG